MKTNRWRYVALATLLVSQLAAAQVIERQFQKPPEPRAVPGGAQIPEALQQAPANAESIRFTLNRLVVEGATVYPAADLQKAYEAFLGKEVSLGEIYRIAEALTARYRNDGYILSQVIVPVQAIDAGSVRLQAIEGYISEVRLEGGTDALREDARDYAERIRETRPLTAAALERYLLLLNDVPGANARAVIAPSKSQSGASDLVIQLSQRQVGGGLAVDNRGGRALGPTRIIGNADAYLPVGRGARTGLMFATSGNDKLNYISLQYDQLVGSEGGKLALAANISRSDPGTFAIIPLNLATNAETYIASYIHPALRSRSQNLYFRGTFSAYNGKTDLFGVPDTEDHLRVVRLGMTYDFADTLAGTNVIDTELSHGLRGLGASSNGDPMLSRPNGRVDFSKITAYAARVQPIVGSWSAFGAFTGQYAFDSVLSPELFSYGGDQFGRGHDPSELVGDHGAAIKLELRYSGALPLASGGNYTAYSFYDHGNVRQRDPAGLKASESAASFGFGVRFGIGPYVTGSIEAAKPVIRVVAAEGNQDTRFYGSIAVRF